jgi:hypothetical protein
MRFRGVPGTGTESDRTQGGFLCQRTAPPDVAGCKPAVRQTKCLRYGAREFVGSDVGRAQPVEKQSPFAS